MVAFFYAALLKAIGIRGKWLQQKPFSRYTQKTLIMSSSPAVKKNVDDAAADAAAHAPELDPDNLAPEYRGEQVDLEVSSIVNRYDRTELCLRCRHGLECKHSMTPLRPKLSLPAPRRPQRNLTAAMKSPGLYRVGRSYRLLSQLQSWHWSV